MTKKKLWAKKNTVKGVSITALPSKTEDYISLTDMLKAKDGDFFISDWLRNRNTVEYLGIWESIYNPDFNYTEFTIIKSQAGLNSYKISVKEWIEKTNAISAILPHWNNWSFWAIWRVSMLCWFNKIYNKENDYYNWIKLR